MNFARFAAISLALAVILGSVGAHALRPLLTAEAFNSWETASRYQIYQSLGILLIALAHMAGYTRKTISIWSLWLITAGMTAFCASLFLRSSTAVHGVDFSFLGAIAPIGGILLIVGWLLAAFSFSVGVKSPI